MKFLVTECEFDLNDDYDMSKDDRLNLDELQIELEDQTVGVWKLMMRRFDRRDHYS